MNKAYLLILIPLIVFGVIYFLIPKSSEESNSALDISYDSPTPTQSIVTPSPVEITASFEIYTNGTERIFTDPKYHNQSDDVYIASNNPNTVVVTKSGTTWNDFFDTLPMKLDKKCLTTGTGQVFCANDGDAPGALRFYINDVEDPDALDKVIEDGNNLRVIYALNPF